jgi:branched-chain amino acid transport system substrate-binding protein
MWSRGWRRVAVCLVALLPAAACSSSGSSGVHVAKIGVVAPLDAGLVQFGRGIRNSVRAAVDDANRRKAVPGWRFEVKAVDDSSNPGTGEAAARRLAADADVIGVVGTYNSGVAAKVAPVLSRAGIVMISPANTDPALTRGADPAHPARPNANYFRLVAADDVQAPFLAKAAFEDVRARRVAVVSETKPVSKGLADGFTAAFVGRGGSAVLTRVVPDGTTDFSEVTKAIAPLRPDLVFYGGEYDGGALFTKQVIEAGISVPVMGGDGIKDDAFITKAGPASSGDLASTVGAPLTAITTAKPFTDAYARGAYSEPASDYGVYSYDAANIIIAAAAKALRGTSKVSPKVRAAILASVQATDTTGASGKLGFDQFGDTRTKVLTLYRVSENAWKPAKTEQVS